MRLPHRLLVSLTVWLVACGDEAPPPDSPEVQFTGVVREADGTPVPRITFTWHVYPEPDSAQQGAVGPGVRWFAQTDSLGRFAEHVGYYSVAQLDSFELSVLSDGCWGLDSLTVRESAIPLTPNPLGTRLNRDLTLTRISPRARFAVGPMCAVMVRPPTFESEDRFALWIDDISDSVRGRWRINYHGSIGDGIGYFAGVRAGNMLTLELRQAEPWGTCAGFTLELPVEAGDTLGAGSYSSTGCPTSPVELRFIEGESLGWPFE